MGLHNFGWSRGGLSLRSSYKTKLAEGSGHHLGEPEAARDVQASGPRLRRHEKSHPCAMGFSPYTSVTLRLPRLDILIQRYNLIAEDGNPPCVTESFLRVSYGSHFGHDFGHDIACSGDD